MTEWLCAFILTEIIEAPLYAFAGRSLPVGRRWAAALGVSAVTHPILWLGYPWEPANYAVVAAAGESFVILTEAILLKAAGFPRPWLASILINGASILVGLAIQAFGWELG